MEPFSRSGRLMSVPISTDFSRTVSRSSTMNRSHKVLAAVGVLLAVLAVAVVPTLAQSDPSASAGYPENTITVIGTGTVHSTPDIATVDVGVDVSKPTVTEGFSEANSKVQDIITALIGLGIAAEDIQTSNLSVYSNTNPNS